MKFFKKTFFGLALIIVLLFLLRNWLFWQLLSYQSIGTRTEYQIENSDLRNYIENNLPHARLHSPQAVMRSALQLSARNLHFTAQHNDIDPNLLINSHRAHCIGYANFTSTVCNELLKKYGLAGDWKAESHRGQIHFLGINIHPYFHSPFFRDHDFVVLKNRKTGEVLATDPTVYDYLRITFIRVKK